MCKNLKAQRLYQYHMLNPENPYVHKDRSIVCAFDTEIFCTSLFSSHILLYCAGNPGEWERILRILKKAKRSSDIAIRPGPTWVPTEENPCPPWSVVKKANLWLDEEWEALRTQLGQPMITPEVMLHFEKPNRSRCGCLPKFRKTICLQKFRQTILPSIFWWTNCLPKFRYANCVP